jgi:magnesium transporter
MLRLFKIDNGLVREFEVDNGQLLDQLGCADWIDAHEPDAGERALLQTLLHTEVPEYEEVEEIETSARCFVDQSGIHVHSMFLAPAEGRHTTVSVACILQSDRLITIREGDLPDFRLMRMRARRGQVECRTPSELLVTLFEQKVENHADTLEDIHRQLEAVSHLVLGTGMPILKRIGRLARLEDSNGRSASADGYPA